MITKYGDDIAGEVTTKHDDNTMVKEVKLRVYSKRRTDYIGRERETLNHNGEVEGPMENGMIDASLSCLRRDQCSIARFVD